ncbi:BTAD domain-containing putative transcriptional regulator [Microtetraspora sp. NBRC 13810]|uniref:AfsR/SARP family transcriptional regulator n=1 Tax=Microtetraspora sp. NBRC 13810 TaxID=3030990 RepID=UPI00255667B6|nr:BTAD domain-containing putative transcriptional regulator [Microtetraspora sp. NBRC 13810]
MVAESGVRFRLLGPVELTIEGRPVALTGQQRLLAAILLLQANRPVSVQRITDGLWGEEPPASAAARVRQLVAELRRACGARGSDLVVTRNPGYLVRVRDGELDTEVFTELVGAAKRAAGLRDFDQALDSYRRAVALWRGAPLADVNGGVAIRAEASRLNEQRLDALECQAEVMLALERFQDVVADLSELIPENPLRERLRGQLMRALQQSGRRPEALEAYRSFRDYLVGELGVEPSGSLRELHQRILRSDVSAAREPETPGPPGASAGSFPVPRQLPASTGRFVGRKVELARLDRLSSDTSRVVLIVGAAGAGKTSLAVHWARRAAERFPDGQLFLDMRGFDPGKPMSRVEALPLLLQALGRAPDQIPHHVDAQGQLYRSLLAGRQVLVVLDNVARPEQVRPLLPGDPRSLVVVTSRDRLPGLVALDGASRLSLDPLRLEEALELIAQRVGQERISAEPGAATRLAEQCGRLPLPLTVAGARLADQPYHGVDDYVRELAERGRLTRLSIDGDEDTAVRAALTLSYQTLTPPARRMFRLLGLAPSGGLTSSAAAALAGLSPGEARDLLDAAARIHLLSEIGADRFSCHDLLKEYAAERAAAEDHHDDRHAAVQRLFDYYLTSIVNVTRISGFHELVVPHERSPAGAVAESFDDESRAMAWIDAAWEDVTAAIAHAAEHGPRPMAWLLVDAVQDVLHHRRPLTEWVRLAELALAAADGAGDDTGRAAMHLSLGHARWRMAELETAKAHYERAETLSRSVRWPKGEAIALRGGGVVLKQLGEPKEALPRYRASIAIARAIGDKRGEAVTLNNLASALLTLGVLDEAESCLTRTLPLAVDTGNRHLEALTLVNLGLIRQKRANFDGAITALDQACEAATGNDFRYAEAVAYETLGRVYNDLGRYQEAAEAHRKALHIARRAENQNCQVDALAGLALAEVWLGRTGDAMKHVTLALKITDRTGHRTGLVDVLIAAAEARRGEGRTEDAHRHARRAIELALEGNPLALGRAHGVLAAVLLDLGDAAGAVEACRRALRAAERMGERLVRARTLTTLGHAHRRAGDQRAAEAAWRSARALFDAIGVPVPGEAATSTG